jgi:hypothetical protein
MNETTIPITVEPEAAARIAELGFQDQVDRMLDYARRNLPQVQRIEIGMNYRYDEDSPDGVCIEIHLERPRDEENRLWWQLTRDIVELFPPEVLEHLHMSLCHGVGDAG